MATKKALLLLLYLTIYIVQLNSYIMKKCAVLLILFVFVYGAVWAQNGYARMTYKEKVVFVNAIPTESYEIVGKAKYKNSKKNEQITVGDVCGLAKVILALDDVNEAVEKGKQAHYDAAIVYSPIKIDLVKFSTADSSIYRKCDVGEKGYKKKCGTKIMCLWSTPIGEYDVAKVVTVENFTNLGQLKMGKNDIDNFINKLYERSCKEAKDGVDFDAIILNDTDLVNKRGFLSTKTIELVKLK